MAPRLKWAVELISSTDIVPRLEDHLIDDLFYQEDEIGEFRHTAFMVECGLEEDPPDGPDVDPVPWGEMLLKQQQEKEQNKITAADENVVVKGGRGGVNGKNKYKNKNNDSDSDDGVRKKGKRELPNRSRSTDDIETLAIELTSSPKARHNSKLRSAPDRSNSVPLDMYVINGKSSPSSSTYVQFSPGSLARKKMEPNRRPEKRIPEIKTSSSDYSASPSTRERRLESQTSSRPKRITPMRGMLTATRSGTCHEMAAAATKAKEKLKTEKENNGGSSSSSRAEGTVPVRGKLVATRSGTPREMATAATKAKKKLNAEKEKKKEYESVVDFPPVSPSVRERRRSIESAAHLIKSPSVLERRNSIESPAKSARPAPLIRSLVATKSGTVHGARKQTRGGKKEENTTDKTEDDDDGSSRIVYKNGKKTVLRRSGSMSKDMIRQRNSLSDSSFSDDNFLDDIVPESDDESVGRSDISVSTCGSETAESRSSPRKEQITFVPKSIPQSLTQPVRKRSLNKKELSDDDHLGSSSKSLKSIDKAKKEKKKKKKKDKQSEGSDEDSKLIPRDSSSSTKKKKKKKKKEKDDESVGRSEISVSTCGSETAESRSSPRKEEKAYVPKSIPQSLTQPVRKRSLNKKELSDDDHIGSSSKSLKSIDKTKKEKKKKKKKDKQSEGSDEDSKLIPRDSSSSIKKKKKKEKEGLDLNNFFSSPISSPIVTEQSRKNHNGSIHGDLRPGCYTSPSSIRSQNRKRLSTTKSTPTEPQKDNVQSPSIIKVEQRQGQTRVPAALACSIDLLATMKKKGKTATTTSYVKPIGEHSRPDDWLGSGQKGKRSWRVKTKQSENTP